MNIMQFLAKLKANYTSAKPDTRILMKLHLDNQVNKWANAGERSTEHADHPSTDWIIDFICEPLPESVFEIGCDTGVNLLRIKHRHHDICAGGADINPVAIEQAIQVFKDKCIPSNELFCMPSWDLSSIPDKSFDVSFSKAVFTIVNDSLIFPSITELIRITEKKIVLFEHHDPDSTRMGRRRKRCGDKGKHWYRDYVNLLMPLAKSVKTVKMPREIWPESLSWQMFGHVIIAELWE